MTRQFQRATTSSSSPPLRCGLALLSLLALLLFPLRTFGAVPSVVIEIDPSAQSILDERAARRFLLLELSEVEVPAGPSGEPPALFVRLLGLTDRQLRVELWERGELYEQRVISGAESGGALFARRVALAAAELARRLRQKRLVTLRQHQRELERLRDAARTIARRTRDGPLALRSEFGVLKGERLILLGPALNAEISLNRWLRLDLGPRLYEGWDTRDRTRSSWFEVGMGPAHRFAVKPRLDLDLGVWAAATLVQFAGALAVDGIASEHQTWTARTALIGRLQPRLSRALRISAGLQAGLFLRSMPVTFPGGGAERYDGFFWGGDLGLVLTPP